MALIWINNISMSFGGPLLLDGASLQIEAGERIGLLGRNGSGKSTLMRLLHRDIAPDAGEIFCGGEVRVSLMPQDIDELPGTVYDVAASGSQKHLDLLRAYHELTLQLTEGGDQLLLHKIEQVQHQLETAGAWQYHRKVEGVISRLSLDEKAEFRLLSAGLKRRTLLARALVSDPDILLLDEPTNHLDIVSILWLEDLLQSFDKTLMFVTHDRTFLQNIATRIVEIDRGKLYSFSCNYAQYLTQRQAMQEEEERQWQTFDKKLAREEVWLRQGIKARRTRNEGRVRALMQLREKRARRREREGNARFAVSEARSSGKLVVDAEKISFAYGDKKIIDTFSTTILRGDRVGIIGPNGSGKTTLLKVLLSKLPISGGKIRLGTGIAIAYFDQLREQFDETKSLKDNIADGSDTVFIGGVPRHIVGYLQDFLFSPEQIPAPVASLSGGERNRLLLAKLFATPSNVLVLDEPTNDLDAETLELLELRLLEYSGTILLVSHDRTFLNNVVTSTIALEGEGRLQEYVGGYDDWLRQRNKSDDLSHAAPKELKAKRGKPPREKRKLSFNEMRELEALPQKIEEMEKAKSELLELLNSPDFYKNHDHVRMTTVNTKLETLEADLTLAYARWDELEELAASLGNRS
ncbi:MAG: ATP-binding cassette domain-containing protein [Deltaproteobacteria bacterium]|nr:ATP-binding cassette domain-containing protein [Deltaproteobacteria bacterium]MBN2688494.1 ATP-binding cassette domain-containing protein [Deltaproteobacteria bacterium]